MLGLLKVISLDDLGQSNYKYLLCVEEALLFILFLIDSCVDPGKLRVQQNVKVF